MLRAQLGSRKLNSPLSQPNLLTKLPFNLHNMIIIYHLNVILIFECDQNQEICLSHSFQRSTLASKSLLSVLSYPYFDWDQRNYPSIQKHQEQYQPCLRPGKRSFFLTLPSPLPPSAQVWVAIFLCVLHLRWKCKCRKNVWRLLQQMDSKLHTG